MPNAYGNCTKLTRLATAASRKTAWRSTAPNPAGAPRWASVTHAASATSGVKRTEPVPDAEVDRRVASGVDDDGCERQCQERREDSLEPRRQRWNEQQRRIGETRREREQGRWSHAGGLDASCRQDEEAAHEIPDGVALQIGNQKEQQRGRNPEGERPEQSHQNPEPCGRGTASVAYLGPEEERSERRARRNEEHGVHRKPARRERAGERAAEGQGEETFSQLERRRSSGRTRGLART